MTQTVMPNILSTCGQKGGTRDRIYERIKLIGNIVARYHSTRLVILHRKPIWIKFNRNLVIN